MARYNDHFIPPHHAKELHAAYAGDKAEGICGSERRRVETQEQVSKGAGEQCVYKDSGSVFQNPQGWLMDTLEQLSCYKYTPLRGSWCRF